MPRGSHQTLKPTLSIEDGRLRPATPRDLDAVLHLFHDKMVRRYLCDDTLLPRETVALLLERSVVLDSRGLGSWVIEDATGALAGLVALQPVSEDADVVPAMRDGIEPMIALRPEMWGRGLASQALRAVVDHAARALGLNELVATVDAPNDASHCLLKACGFKEIGRAPGPAHELVLYRLILETSKAG